MSFAPSLFDDEAEAISRCLWSPGYEEPRWIYLLEKKTNGFAFPTDQVVSEIFNLFPFAQDVTILAW